MLTRKSCLKIALMVGLVPLAGCGTSSMAQRSGTTKDVAMQRPNIRTRAVSADSASELRIPATPVSASGGSQRVSNNDIPLFPIPPVPRKEEVQQTNIARTNLNPANPNTMSNFPTERTDISPNSNPAKSAETKQTPLGKDINVPGDPMKTLYQRAAAKTNSLESYIVRLVRREVINGKKKPEELMLMKYRRAPLSIYFKWLEGEGVGREVVYVENQYENKIHSLLAAGDIPFMPGGKRMAMAPDSIFVKNASRHTIQDAGFVPLITALGKAIDAQSRRDSRFGTVKYHPAQVRKDIPVPTEALEHFIPAGLESDLPKGGRRFVSFDPETYLPMLIVTYDERNEEVEYYRYDRFQNPVHLDNKDFNPDILWAKPGTQVGLRK